ncbi:polyubiquitin-like [Orbicella faveolata]|uniref:polyubiquitin-like n=1 Tax=Orbicella faveolata TaxID=48498 RepID=UPI0009E5D5FD|nr:polyubiquitin-like [Orbicella faveolata]
MRPYLLDVPTPDFYRQIFVKTHSGKTVITIEIEPEDTVQVLKREIRDETGIPNNQQHITFNGNKLEDDRTLHSYGIRYESVLYMRPYLLDVPVSDFVPKIFVKTHSGNTVITIVIVPGLTVRALKREIRDETGMPTNQQHITFAGNKLEDDRTLSSYGIRDGSVLYMCPYREARCCKKCVVS